MFNRLIIAVLTLGLLLTFSSVVFSSDPDVTPIDGISPIIRINPDAPKYQDLKSFQQTENLDRPSGNLHAIENPSAILPPNYLCDVLGYYMSWSWYWYLPDESYPLDEYCMRMTPEPGYVCSLNTIWIVLYGPHINDPGARVTLRDASLTMIDYVDIDAATIAGIGYGWLGVDFSTLNGGSAYTFVDGEEFYIGLQAISDGDDTLFILSDDGEGASGRMRMHLGAPYNGWYSWTGDYAYIFEADVCCARIPYTSCYTLDYYCNVWYSWLQPDAYGDDYFNMRFSVAGPETLVEIGVAFDNGYTVGTPDVDLFVWYDDGAGFPGTVAPGFPVTIPYAQIVWYPGWTTYTLPTPIEFRSDFHVGWSTGDANPNDVLAGISDDGTCGLLRSSENWAGFWGTMLADWGADVNFLIYAQMCRDEFSRCKWISDICNLAYFWGFPSTSRTAFYEKFSPMGLGCRLEQVDFVIYDNGDPNLFLLPTNANVFMSDGGSGLPGTLLNTTVINPPYVFFPGMQSVDYTGLPYGGITFDADIWAGLEPLAPIGQGINTLSDDYTCNTGVSCVEAYGTFEYTGSYYGVEVTFYVDAYVCCVPTPERACLTVKGLENWPTYGKDFGRSHASLVSLGADVQGTLTKAWQYTSTGVSNMNSPVIYNDTVVNVFLNQVVALDLNTGLQIWLQNDGFIASGGMFGTPTIYNFVDFGVDETYVFFGGGASKAFTALYLSGPNAGDSVWSQDFLDHGGPQADFVTWGTSVIVDCEGTPVVIYNTDNGDIWAVEALTGVLYTGWSPNPKNFGGNVGHGITLGGGLLYIGTEATPSDGNVFAVEPCTGNEVWNFENTAGHQCVNLDNESYVDIGYQGEGHLGGISYDPPSEDFPDATLYFASSYGPNGETIYYSGGIVYSVDAMTGALNWASVGIAGDYCAVVLDGGHIINSGWAPWVTGYGIQKGPTAFSKETGAELYTRTTRNPGQDVFMLADGLLSCEVEQPDWFVAGVVTGGDRYGFLEFYESDDPGRNRFHRRFSGWVNAAHHVAPAMVDEHLLFCHVDKLMCLTPQDPRPRLDIPRYRINTPVPFGLTSPNHVVYFPDPATDPLGLPGAIGNLGGAPLLIDSVTLADTSNGLIPPDAGNPGGAPLAIVDPTLVDNMEKLASKFASNVDHFRASISDDLGIEYITQSMRSTRNNAAFALPSWIDSGSVTPTPGTVIPAPGDYTDSSTNYVPITIEVDGPNVPRGLTALYAFVYSDDPDYFLDSALMDVPKALAAAVPVIQLGIVGGCLYEDVVMDFGEDYTANGGGSKADNWAHIWNATMLADGDILSIEIDGDAGSFWQGAFIFATEGTYLPPGKPAGVFSQKVAHYAQNWSAAYSATWQSILPDPNCVVDSCPPRHVTNVLLGQIDTTTIPPHNYHDVFGEVVSFAFIDSVQDFCIYDTLGVCQNWDWPYAQSNHEGIQPPYEGAWTMGFSACVTVIGAYEEARLNNFYIEKFEFNGRYGAVDDVWMGMMVDYDINYNAGHTQQVAGHDADISTAWAYTCNNNTNGWGFVKIPFDASGSWPPMVNAKTLSADQSAWNDSAVWLDSVHFWMSTLTGATHQVGTDPAICAADPSDRDWFGTVGELDMPGPQDDPLTVGVAVFGLPSLPGDADQASAYQRLAITADKWCGFWRGDCDDDEDIDPVDIALLIDFVHHGGRGPYPFMYLGDVDCDDDYDNDDILFLIRYVFQFDPVTMTPGVFPPPCGKWEL